MHICCSHISCAVSCTNSTPGWGSIWFLLVPQNEFLGAWNLLVSYITHALHHQVHAFIHWCIPHSFVTSCKDHPVHLWDAFYYHRRASYVPHNHLVRTCCILQITQNFPNNGFDVNIQCSMYAQIWRQVLPIIYIWGMYIHCLKGFHHCVSNDFQTTSRNTYTHFQAFPNSMFRSLTGGEERPASDSKSKFHESAYDHKTIVDTHSCMSV